MTDTITGWRTVATHGSPTTADVPVLVRTATCGAYVRPVRGTPLTHPRTRWIPLAELDALPDAPPPPRTVTITITDDDARDVLGGDWNTLHPMYRTLAAVKAALAADETNR